MTCLTCPQGRREYHKYDSLIRCNGKAIPILAAYNTKEGVERTGKPHWCPLDPVEIMEKPKKQPKPQERPQGRNRWFTDDQIRDIRKKYWDGKTIGVIAKEYEVAWATIRRITSRKNYKDVI